MRPKSILLFERLYLASLTLNVVGIFLRVLIAQDWGLEGVSPLPVLIGTIVFLGMALPLWFFVARKASRVARMLLCAVAIWGVVDLWHVTVAALRFSPAYAAVTTTAWLCQYAATAVLFRRDADQWLANRGRPMASVQDVFG